MNFFFVETCLSLNRKIKTKPVCDTFVQRLKIRRSPIDFAQEEEFTDPNAVSVCFDL